MSKGQLETDCTRRCKSRNHGQVLTSAITKRSVTDAALASFIKTTCANFNQAFDFEGRTALHMSASRGRSKLIEWLAGHSSDAIVNARDEESGYTALHRSIFYGQIHTAVALMKFGVNTDIVDKDDYKAIEHATLDRQYMRKGLEGPTDVYVWGTNSNYTLGTHTHQKTPDLLNCFSRSNASIKQVCLGKFHSVWLSSSGEDGEVWACGQLGRAGASVATSLRPVLLKLSEPCVQLAITVDTTVLLMQSGAVLQYSQSNTSISQSTSRTPSVMKLPSVKPLLKLSEASGVCASRVHACAWTVRAVYTWGLNVGQLGHSQPSDGFVDAPKRVTITVTNAEEAGIQLVAASDAATVMTTSRGDVYLLHKHMCKKIAVKQINLRQVCVEAKVSEHGVYSRVTVLLLTDVGQLHIWQDTTNKLTRCVFGLTHQTVVTGAALTHDALYVTTKHGEAYIGNISRKSRSTAETAKRDKDSHKNRDSQKGALVRFLEKDDCTAVRLTRVPNLHRAVSITADSEGLNFACLQSKPSYGLPVSALPVLSPSCMSKHMGTLLETTDDVDILHDVVFRIGAKRYPAHIFVVAAGSEHLYKLYQERKLQQPEEKPEIVLENVIPDVFDRILRYLYTGTCDVIELGPCDLKIRKDDLIKNDNKNKDNVDTQDAIENPSEISAFEAYKTQSAQKKRKHRGHEPPPRAPDRPPDRPYCDPVKLVQAAAKRLQVMTLHKLLDKYYYRDGSIQLRDKATDMQPATPVWDRSTCPELVDTRVRSKDGVALPAHRCVLAARLDYFSGMFMHSWSESKQLSTVSLPINHGILLPIINFLYTDSCPDVESSDSLDYICSLLIVADQLFITRLREMCEVALANMVTLKNCAELCQFAHTYNAGQLKQYCMEFISLNLGCILENRSLEVLDDALLDNISEYYCKVNPIMSFRVVTPFFNAPTDETVNEYAKLCPVDLDAVDCDYKKEDSFEVKKKRSAKKTEYTDNEKARKRYESVSSVTSLDLSHDTSGDITLSLSKMTTKETEKGSKDKQEKWVEVPTSQQKQQKVVQARLKAIASAKDILNESPTESFVTLGKTNSYTAISSSPNENYLPTTSRMSVSPKESFADLARSPQGSFIISHVGPKLSQKQRKKLAMQGNESTIQNLDDYFNKPVQESTPSKPKNPWKICEGPAMCGISNIPMKPVGFTQILADQKKQKDDLSRIMTKPLNLTQLEDKAIEDLERFYNIHEADDELISVRRIELQVAPPQWPHTTSK